MYLLANSHCLCMIFRTVNFSNLCGRHKHGETWPQSKMFKVRNDENIAPEGQKASKFRTIELSGIVEDLKIDMFAPNGWPSVSIDALKILSGKIPMDQIYTIEDDQERDEYSNGSELPEQDIEAASSYGTAYEPFGGGKKGTEACHAIAALCERSSIDKLISSFILPLQVSLLILLIPTRAVVPTFTFRMHLQYKSSCATCSVQILFTWCSANH